VQNQIPTVQKSGRLKVEMEEIKINITHNNNVPPPLSVILSFQLKTSDGYRHINALIS